ncbi:MAG: TatD family hydrolase [Clostridia bacterium]|nr:TatD family hydrolase [Clostridia bacterium]
MRIFDTHLHLASEQFEQDLDSLLMQARACHVEGCLIACDPGDLEPDHARALSIAGKYDNFYIGVACHPQNALNFSPERAATICRIAEMPICRCIGETGLDYYDNQSSRAQQLEVLNWHFDLAMELNKPVQLHIRNAHGDMIDLMRTRKKKGSLPRAFLHCFTRSYELAKVYLSMGCYISIGGAVTYANANRLLETVQRIPINRLLIETDAPWVAPEPHRGGRCEPAYILHTFEKIAALRNMEPEELSRQLWENTAEILGI